MDDQPAMGGYAYPNHPQQQSQGNLNPHHYGDYYHGGQTPSTEKRTDVVSVHSEAPRTELRRALKERHVNMIGFSMVLGVYDSTFIPPRRRQLTISGDCFFLRAKPSSSLAQAWQS